jgi:hypothetical protein
MAYNINFQALALWLGVIIVASGGYYFVTSSQAEASSFSIGMEEDTVPGELTRLSVEQEGEPVQGANISIDGEFIGTTNSQGIKGFETPENNFTVQASKGDISSETTFAVTEEGGFESPDDESSDSGQDDSDEDDSSDDSGSDNDRSDDSDGSEDDTGEDETDESQDSTSEDSEDDTTEITDDYTGLELSQDPAVGELLTVTVYEDGETQSGVEVTVDDQSVGTTNSAGTVNFGVPDTEKITVSTDSGLEEAFNVEGYTQDDQQQEDDNQTKEGDTTTGIQLDSDPVSGTTNRIILYDNGDRVSGETVYLDGEELGQTGTNGAIEFEVPLKDQITVSTDYDLKDQTFDVQQNHPEPEITLLSPDDTASFDTPTGTNYDVTFEASVDITESSGTATLMIDGTENKTWDLSQGSNSISTTQALSGGSHAWSLEVDTSEFNTSSSERGLTVNEIDPKEGLSLRFNAKAGESNYVILYENNEPVEGEEIFVNGDSIGSTNQNGEVGFELPNEEEITITTETGLDELTKSVDGYEYQPVNINFITPSNGETVNDYRTTFNFGIENEEVVSYEFYIDGSLKDSGDIPESQNISYQEDHILADSGEHSLTLTVFGSEDQTLAEETRNFETTEPMPEISFDLQNPADGTTVNDYESTFQFDVDSEMDYDFEFVVNDTVVENTDLLAGQSLNSVTHVFDNTGTHNWRIRATVQDNGETFESAQRTIETTDEPPVAEVTAYSPSGANASDLPTTEDELSLNYAIRNFEDVTHTAYIVKDGGQQNAEHTGQLTEQQTHGILSDSRTFEAGNYEWWVEVESLETGEIVTSDTLTFEVVQN